MIENESTAEISSTLTTLESQRCITCEGRKKRQGYRWVSNEPHKMQRESIKLLIVERQLAECSSPRNNALARGTDHGGPDDRRCKATMRRGNAGH